MESTTEGTTVSTEVARAEALQSSAVAALDSQLISNAINAFHAGEKTMGQLVNNIGAIAGAILDLHEAGTWERTIDGVTGKAYTSPKAFYASLFAAERFPLLATKIQTGVVELLMDGGKLAGIGTNELAAIFGCDGAQITRKVKAINAKAAAEEVKPTFTDEDLQSIADEAKAAALQSGMDEKAATHAGEVARAEAKAAAGVVDEEAAAAAKLAAEKAAEEEEFKKANSALRQLVNATSRANDVFHLATPERRAESLEAAQEYVKAVLAFEANLKKASATGRQAKATATARGRKVS